MNYYLYNDIYRFLRHKRYKEIMKEYKKLYHLKKVGSRDSIHVIANTRYKIETRRYRLERRRFSFCIRCGVNYILSYNWRDLSDENIKYQQRINVAGYCCMYYRCENVKLPLNYYHEKIPKKPWYRKLLNKIFYN